MEKLRETPIIEDASYELKALRDSCKELISIVDRLVHNFPVSEDILNTVRKYGIPKRRIKRSQHE